VKEGGLGLTPGAETARIRAFLDGVRIGQGGSLRSEELVTVRPGDDAAAFEVPAGRHVVVSTDASVEGIHFRREWMTWETIGYRAAAAALSDLAAMAAVPVGLLCSVALPPELDAGVSASLGHGVGEALAVVGGEALGGDLVQSPGPVMLDVVAVGHVAVPVRRSGAHIGDEVWVTGALGGAAAAVGDLRVGLEPIPAARRAFERPVPRVEEAIWLAAEASLTALIDLSDGIGQDARHLACASGVRLELELERIPAHPAVEPYMGVRVGARLLLGGGEDYELLLTVPPGAIEPIHRSFEDRFGLALTRIGRVTRGTGLTVSDPGGSVCVEGGYDHFEPT